MPKLRVVLPVVVLVLAGVVSALLVAPDGGHPRYRLACSAGESDARGCGPGGIESPADMAKANGARASRTLAPTGALKPGAYRAAVRDARALPSTGGGDWTPIGDTPLQGNNKDYDVSDGSTLEGLPGLSGRVTAFAQDDKGAIYAAASNGGVWRSTDSAATWSSIGDGLPTQVVAGIAWSSAHGGTLLALTGDNAYGGDTYSGLGAYYSVDGGQSWQHAGGVPDDVLGFKLAVDPTDPNKVYAATGAGLFRSTDGGQSYVNTNLPTGKGATPDCSGKPPTVKDCFLANMVTDVVVQAAGGPAKTKGGAVMAAVGWRAGQRKNADGTIQAPGNGIYVSDTGAPGSFKNADMAGNAQPRPPSGTETLTQSQIGRIALGAAYGASQDHNIVYAIVEDADKFNGGAGGIDVPEFSTVTASSSLNAVWVSTDFGKSWSELEGSSAIDTDPTTGSALAPPVCKGLNYCPGVQAWYNLWVQPDPTQQTSAGVPTRLAFGLEEVWENNSQFLPPTGLDGSVSTKFDVIGRYYGDKSCNPFKPTNVLGQTCPPGDLPATTTHPDQHGYLFVPDGNGGVTLVVGNDGGVFTQKAASGADFVQSGWGNGANKGMHTLQPYDAEIAKDGTVYMGLQDNGQAKIEPSGKSYTIYGGDGGFTAVDPDHSNTVYEEYTYGDVSVSTDGGKNWTDIAPNIDGAQFTMPFQMDPNASDHLLIGGQEILETTAGPATSGASVPAPAPDIGSWTQVFDLGKAPSGATNQLSAVDVIGTPPVQTGGSGAKTPDKSWKDQGGDTIPGPSEGVSGGQVFTPGSYVDFPITIGANDGDASMVLTASWADPTNDWDMWLFSKASDGTLTEISGGGGATGNDPEKITVPVPKPGDYVIRVANYSATGTFDLSATFTQGSAEPVHPTEFPSDAYVGYCGYCDLITQGVPFANGIATNVGGDKPGKTLSGDGWHFAKAQGLPSRYITSIRMDPQDHKTIYATLAGYGRRWAKPGAVGDDTSKVGTGHVFRSTDAGQTFTDVSGDLPDAPANWSLIHNGRLVVGTDLGVFESCNLTGGAYFRLGNGLPAAPISTLRLKPGDPDTMLAATYGRGPYTYHFTTADDVRCPSPATAVAAAGGKGSTCAATAAVRAVRARPTSKGRHVRLTLPSAKRSQRVDIFQVSRGLRHIEHEHLMLRLHGRKGVLNWNGRSNRKGRRIVDGYYFARVLGPGKGVVSRVVLERRRGRWHVRPDFSLRGSCGLVSFAKFERPVFGGDRHFKLRFTYALKRAGKVNLVLWRGKHVVHSFGIHGRRAGHHYRVALGLKGLRKGAYTAVLQATSGKQKTLISLVSRRI